MLKRKHAKYSYSQTYEFVFGCKKRNIMSMKSGDVLGLDAIFVRNNRMPYNPRIGLRNKLTSLFVII